MSHLSCLDFFYVETLTISVAQIVLDLTVWPELPQAPHPPVDLRATVSGHLFSFSHLWLSTTHFSEVGWVTVHSSLLPNSELWLMDGWIDMVCKPMAEEGDREG